MGILIKEVSRLLGEGAFGTIEVEMFEGEGTGKLFLSKELERGTLMFKCGDAITKKEFFGSETSFIFAGICKDYAVKVFELGSEILGFSTTGDFSEKLSLEKSPQILEDKVTDAFEDRVAVYNYYDETPLKMEVEENMVFNLTSSLLEKTNEPALPKTNLESKTSENAKTHKSTGVEEDSSASENNNEKKESLEKSGKSFKKQSFFETVKEDIDKLFQNFPPDEFLENLVDNSQWVKVQFDDDHSYSVGLIYADDKVEYIGYGIIGTHSEIPKELSIATQFLPLDFKTPQGEGYHLVYQRADNGDSVK